MVRKIAKSDAQKAAKNVQAVPAPFTIAPASLDPFLEDLDPSLVYIVHVDKHPAALKKRVFTVPVVLNLSIAILLAWRAWVAVPTYLALFATIIGHNSPATIDRAAYTTSELIWIVIRRTLMFALDFVLVRFILPWPISFFIEAPANPVFWRRNIGFRDAEIVVRMSRRWGAEDLLQGAKTGQESPFFKTRVLPAIDRAYVREKTGYMMMDKSWDLDFAAMVYAHQIVDGKNAPLDLFEKTVLVHQDGGAGWLCWQVWKLDQGGEEEDARKKMGVLKDRLTLLGKESLFWSWLDIVQFESNKPGDFSQARQEATLEKIRAEFTKQGVDFDRVVKDIGGLDGAPGMQAAT